MQYQPIARAQRRFGNHRVLVVEQHELIRAPEYARHVDRDGLDSAKWQMG